MKQELISIQHHHHDIKGEKRTENMRTAEDKRKTERSKTCCFLIELERAKEEEEGKAWLAALDEKPSCDLCIGLQKCSAAL